MTIFIFLGAFSVFALAMLNALPNANLENLNTMQEAFEYFVGIIKSFDFILPADTLFICVQLITFALIAKWIFNITRWTLGIVRGGHS